MKRLLKYCKAYCDSQGWKYTLGDEGEYIRLQMSMKEVDHVTILIRARDNTFTVNTYFPINVNEAKRDEMSEFICRANYGLVVGCFEMDYSDGEIRYRATGCFKNSDPDLESVEMIVDMGFLMFNRYTPGIMAVLYGGKDPKSAVDMCENND
ncbi:MAG: YbjN domain-containing protein [Clostridia bacterium]|nr:YbjN domain-containing protein [Clostridia bacterium]